MFNTRKIKWIYNLFNLLCESFFRGIFIIVDLFYCLCATGELHTKHVNQIAAQNLEEEERRYVSILFGKQHSISLWRAKTVTSVLELKKIRKLKLGIKLPCKYCNTPK